MSLPAVAVRTASFLIATALVWLAYPVLAALIYLGLMVASAVGDQPPGGPLAGPLLVLLGAIAGLVCVGIAVPTSIAGRAAGGIKGILAGAAVLVFLSAGSVGLVWVLFDPPGSAVLAAAILVALATPAALVLTLADLVAGPVTRLLATRSRPVAVEG